MRLRPSPPPLWFQENLENVQLDFFKSFLVLLIFLVALKIILHFLEMRRGDDHGWSNARQYSNYIQFNSTCHFEWLALETLFRQWNAQFWLELKTVCRAIMAPISATLTTFKQLKYGVYPILLQFWKHFHTFPHKILQILMGEPFL